MNCFHVYFPSRIPKIFGNVLVEGFGLLSSITAKFYWFILFFTSFATSFQLHKMFFWTEHKEAHCLRNLSDNDNFLLLFFIFWYTFWAPIRFEHYNYRPGYDPDSYKKIKKSRKKAIKVCWLESAKRVDRTATKRHVIIRKQRSRGRKL